MTEREKQLNDAVYSAALSAQSAQKPEYAGTFEGQLNDLYDKIANREKFHYDVNADPLYQSYKDQYIQGGKLAMKDTMGQAAALTGGYGNTYGQQVGQQAYDAYLQNLSAAIPELYGMAYKKYQDEGDQLKDLYGLVGQQRDAEYGRYRDALGDWERGQAVMRDLEAQEYDRRMQAEALAKEQERYDYQRVWNEEVRDYERNRDAEQTAYDRQMAAEAIQRQLEAQAYERRWNEENRDYSRQMTEEQIQRELEQQSWSNQQKEYEKLRQMIAATGYRPSSAELQAAGMSQEMANALANEFDRQRALEELAREAAAYSSSGGSSGRSSGGSSGSSGRYSGTSPSYSYDYDYDYAPATSTGSLLNAGASKAASLLSKTSFGSGVDAISGAAPSKTNSLTAIAASNPTRSNIVAAANAAVNSKSISKDEFNKIMNSLPKSR